MSIAQAADFGGEGYDACGAVSGGPGPYVDSSEEDEDDERDASGFLASIGEDAAVAAGDDGGDGNGAIAPMEALERRAETNPTPGLAAYLRAKAEKRERRKNRAPRSDPSLFAERETQRRVQGVVEADRNASAAERGMKRQVLMEPPAHEDDVLVGIPSRTRTARLSLAPRFEGEGRDRRRRSSGHCWTRSDERASFLRRFGDPTRNLR